MPPKRRAHEHDTNGPGSLKRLKSNDSEDELSTAAQEKFSNEDYTVGWICAINPEYVAAQSFLDEEHDRPEYVAPNDSNDYTLGRIGKHNVVIAVLPKGEYGIASAANVASRMLFSFKNVRLGLMVGIGGGAPSSKHDIRLGDIVVSTPYNKEGGVIQYDFGKAIQDKEFKVTGHLNQPPVVFRTAVSGLEAQYERHGHQFEDAFDVVFQKNPRLRNKYKRPDPNTDKLYESSVTHPNDDEVTCAEACDPTKLVHRKPRTEDEDNPAIHYGIVASANTLMKNALLRDKFAKEHDVLCFEMEAAGLMNNFPCLVIRGICDYSDSHKKKEWQGYAAMAAAAYARDLLVRIPVTKVKDETKINDVIHFANAVHVVKSSLEKTKDDEILASLRITDPRSDKKRIENTQGGLLKDLYRWVLENPSYKQWHEDPGSELLWIKGDPGKGKTMLLCGIIEELEKSMSKTTILSYFFCQATDSRINNATAVMRGLLYMLVSQQPALVSYIRETYDQECKTMFKDVNAWVELEKILTDVLRYPGSNTTYLIIDALDECVTDLPKLLEFVVKHSSTSSRVKWIVSSRNWLNIEESLKRAGHKVQLCLELNAESVSTAVSKFIQYKVSQLAERKGYNDVTRDAVLRYLSLNANDTFLWVALVCQTFMEIHRWDILARLNEFPAGLNPLYKRMMKQISDSRNATRFKPILASIATVYRPITLEELTSLSEQLDDVANDLEAVKQIVSLCGSFLTVRENTIYFVHQSAKDFLLNTARNEIFPSTIEEVHYTVFSRSLQVMSKTFRRDMHSLGTLGYPAKKVQRPDVDPLAASYYSCIY